MLTGGAAVSVYTNNQYQSKDIDLISTSMEKRKAVKQAMFEIGFNEENRYFVHPDTQFLVEFPAGPLAVGKQPVEETTEILLSTGTLLVLTPTDCVKDRLSAFYYWNDNQALAQAVLVTQHAKVDIAEVEQWSIKEGMLPKFHDFQAQLTFPKMER